MNLKTAFFFSFCCLYTLLTPAQNQEILGFGKTQSEAQRQLEKAFDQSIKAADLDQWMKRLAARPHHVGSAYGASNAAYMDSLFTSWGFDSEIVTYQVLAPTPKVRELTLLEPTTYKAELQERSLEEDPYTFQTDEQLPTYTAYSADGDVTGDLVFVNYGEQKDYEKLAALGVSVEGKIVIVKYGRSFRGIKPKIAYEHGAIGCLIYSEPQDDGYTQGDVYPQGPFKNSSTVQRGSILDITTYPGDPLTPGYGATQDAKRLPKEEAETIQKIPVQPISYGDAQPLLAALTGAVAPLEWAGSLPITYHVGGNNQTKVHLKLAFHWDLLPVHNVIAKIKGSQYPDQWIIRGNHHDGWVNGAADPLSGMVAELSEAKAIGELVKNGYQPKRTLVYTAWDGEEFALLGSTEWAEDHAKELQEKTVAYINTDNSECGFLYAGGSHTLEKFFTQIAYEVKDPQAGISLAQRKLNQESIQKNKHIKEYKIGALGSGSDYSVFLQHLGIAAIDLGFFGQGNGGEYHSIYDNYRFFKLYKDPGFAYGVALAKVAGRTVLRLANAEILPFEFTHFAQTLEGYQKELSDLATQLQEDTKLHNTWVQQGAYTSIRDKNDAYSSSPEIEQEVPDFNFAPLEQALEVLRKQAAAYQKAYEGSAQELNAQEKETLNKALYQSERYLIRAEGLPNRPWFKNFIYAPGYYTGYGVKTLPGIRESIEEKHFDQVNSQIEKVGKTLTSFSQQIQEINQQFP